MSLCFLNNFPLGPCEPSMCPNPKEVACKQGEIYKEGK